MFSRRKLDAVRDIRDGIAIRVDLDFIQRARREGLICRRPKRAHSEGRVYVQDQD
jgi:hypothetical protein